MSAETHAHTHLTCVMCSSPSPRLHLLQHPKSKNSMGGGGGGVSDGATRPNPSPASQQHSLFLTSLMLARTWPQVEVGLEVLDQDPPPPSGLLLLGEVEDLAVSLSQVLLLLEVHLERTLDGYEGDAPLMERKRPQLGYLGHFLHV